jgi:hypothetical protein
MYTTQSICFLIYTEFSATLLFMVVCSYYPDIILIAAVNLPSYGGNERNSNLQFKLLCSGQHLVGRYRKLLRLNHNYCALSTVWTTHNKHLQKTHTCISVLTMITNQQHYLIVSVSALHLKTRGSNLALVTCSTHVFKPEILSSLAVRGLYYINSQIRGVVPRIKIYQKNLYPSVDRSIRGVQQLQQVFEPYHVMLKQPKG